MSVATEKAQRVKVVNATRASGIAWSKQLWDCELSCGHSQRVTGRSGGAPMTTTCDTCAGKPWSKRSQPAVPKPVHPLKPTELQLGILYAAADLARYIVQVEDVAALLRRQGLADADCSDLEEMDKEELRVLRDDFGLLLRGLD